MKVQEALKHLENKKLDQMKESLTQALSEKAVQKLNEVKKDLANQFFRK